MIAKAYGRVLEIGSGTGINFPYYMNVCSVDAIEPNPYMIKRSKFNLNRANVPISIHQQTAENLSFPDHTFDSVICTLVFCTIKDPKTALDNILQVTKPNGTILFLEHVKIAHSWLGKSQDFLNPVWKRIAGGCNLNRDTLNLIKQSPLNIVEMETLYKGLVIKAICTKAR